MIQVLYRSGWYIYSQLKRSPTEGRGAREPWELVGSLERSGRRASLRVSSSFTPVTLSSFAW